LPASAQIQTLIRCRFLSPLSTSASPISERQAFTTFFLFICPLFWILNCITVRFKHWKSFFKKTRIGFLGVIILFFNYYYFSSQNILLEANVNYPYILFVFQKNINLI
jgi:hypothetical protein